MPGDSFNLPPGLVILGGNVRGTQMNHGFPRGKNADVVKFRIFKEGRYVTL